MGEDTACSVHPSVRPYHAIRPCLRQHVRLGRRSWEYHQHQKKPAIVNTEARKGVWEVHKFHEFHDAGIRRRGCRDDGGGGAWPMTNDQCCAWYPHCLCFCIHAGGLRRRYGRPLCHGCCEVRHHINEPRRNHRQQTQTTQRPNTYNRWQTRQPGAHHDDSTAKSIMKCGNLCIIIGLMPHPTVYIMVLTGRISNAAS